MAVATNQLYQQLVVFVVKMHIMRTSDIWFLIHSYKIQYTKLQNIFDFNDMIDYMQKDVGLRFAGQHPDFVNVSPKIHQRIMERFVDG